LIWDFLFLRFRIFDIVIKTRVRVEMSDVCDETLKSIYGTFLFRTALESECLEYLGHKYQLNISQIIQLNIFQKEGIFIRGPGCIY
jgi:hypothetical protein